MLVQFLMSFIAAAGFGIIFNVPKKTLIQGGLAGAIGWLAYLFLVEFQFDQVFATFVASFIVAVFSHIFSKVYKTPMIIFSVAGIIPLVPGGLAYDAMRHVVQQEYTAAIELAAKAFMISGAIAMGLIFSEVMNQVLVKRIRAANRG